jgi:hypothetical protein
MRACTPTTTPNATSVVGIAVEAAVGEADTDVLAVPLTVLDFEDELQATSTATAAVAATTPARRVKWQARSADPRSRFVILVTLCKSC